MIQFYDSLRGEKVPFHKKPGEKVGMYVCGPTVYDFAHLGHGRSAVAFDLIRRFLEFSGYEVNFVSNFTDIDDKMIDRAAKEGISVEELSDRIIPEYEADYGLLGIKPPTHKPKATEYVPQMIDIIRKLEAKGCTYVLEDGVYFDIKTFPEYGKLSHQKLEELNAGARMEERKDKRNHQDFVLWKFKKEGEPFWQSPWGEGRPGWHIECSAMSSTLLGEHFDIHGGGLDLKFPHHECELAQSEAASGLPLADIWMHNGYITVNEEKMSKSLNNFFTLKEIFEPHGPYAPLVVRFFLLSAHYRSPLEFTHSSLQQAEATLDKLRNFCFLNLAKDGDLDTKLIAAVTEKMENDLDLPGAFGLIFAWMKTGPSKPRKTLEKIDEFLGIFKTLFEPRENHYTLPIEDDEALGQLEDARAVKNYVLADQIRDELVKKGYDIQVEKNGNVAWSINRERRNKYLSETSVSPD